MTDRDGNGVQDVEDGSEPEELIAVPLPGHLVTRVEERVERTDFETTADYVSYVLEHVLSRVESDGQEAAHQAVDRADVEERLQSLGYLE